MGIPHLLTLLLHLLAFLQPVSFVICIIWICVDIFWLARPGHRGRNLFASPTPSSRRGFRRLYASVYLLLAVYSAMKVISYQNTYTKSVDLLHSQRGQPQSFYPRFFENWGHLMPQMFQMMHLRAWAGEAQESRPEWAYFLWNSQQYFAGLITFAFFLIIQSRVRPLRLFTIFTFIWISMTSLSCAHCLLFYFILVTPPLQHERRYVTEWLHKIIALLTIFQHLAVYSMMHNLNTANYQKCLLYTLVLPLIVPVISWLLPKQPSFKMRFVTIHEAQSNVFLTSGYVSALLHWYSFWTIWCKAVEIDPKKPSYRLHLNQADALQQRNEFGWLWWNLLGHDPSFSAITWDIVLTFVSLLIWTIVNRTSFKGMMRSSIFWRVRSHQMPIWDGQNDVVEDDKTRAEIRALYGNTYPEVPRSEMSDAHMIREWESRAAEGRAVAMVREPPMPLTPSRLPLWLQQAWVYGSHVVLAFVLYWLGGLGWVSAGVLGAGPNKLVMVKDLL